MSRRSGRGFQNPGEIRNTSYFVYIKGGYIIILLGLIIGIWQKDNIRAWLGYDRFFKADDENFKILILPFKQMCEMSGKNYDAGYVLAERLVQITKEEDLKIEVKYWSDFQVADYFFDQTARELQQYHHADMLVFGVYQTSDCSAEGDQICLNYVTDEKWNLGMAGTNFSSDYQKGGFDDLKKGRIQEKVENIARFISILAQIKSLDHAAYLEKLQVLLNEPDFSSSSKLDIILELADKLVEEGKLNEPLVQFENGLQISIEQENREYRSIFLSRIGETHRVRESGKGLAVF
ncbi:MAG: hypothetical protein H6575_06435 [Lewinellaceae bacterium]|nr:hypothetical protein [Lewinellaceae bacterium]